MNLTQISEERQSKLFSIRKPILKVLGLGGGGCNAVNRMIELNIQGVEFIAANTDQQALENSLTRNRIQLGPKLTRGLGTGGKPEIGKAAAEESRRDLVEALRGADMVFLTAGMGGGTGTGAIPIAAEVSRSLGAVTIAVVTTPFTFEMGRRQNNASAGLNKLRKHTDTLIAIPNERLLLVAPKDLPMETAFRLADDVLRQAVQGITELITQPGIVNVDFSHIRRLMKLGGGALMSIGQAEGIDKAEKAVQQALSHPLMDTVSLENASGIIANFTGGNDLTLYEVGAALNQLHENAGKSPEVVMGVNHDERMKGRVEVILVVTGLGAKTLEEVLPGSERLNQISTPEAERIPPKPTISTRKAEMTEEASEKEPEPASTNRNTTPVMDELDIPAFMRRRSRFAG